MANICIGVDVGGTSVKCGIFLNDGKLLRKWEIPTSRENNCAAVIPDIAHSLEEVLQTEKIDKKDVIGVGMGVPGPVQADGYVPVSVNLHWKDLYPAKQLEELLGLKVKLGNDANIAALGEAWQGGAKGCSSAVLLTLGTGIGGGIITNNQILTGAHGIAGEIGHLHVRDGEKEYCNCGGQGCLEQIASATGIVREAKRIMVTARETESVMREFGDRLTAKDVCDCAKAGDDLANRVLETVCRYLGLAISHIAMTVDPEIFVIGGGVSKAGQFLVDKIMKHYEYYTPIVKEHSPIVLATLGNDAGIYGGARMVL